MTNNQPDTLKMQNGLIQIIRMEESIRLKRIEGKWVHFQGKVLHHFQFPSLQNKDKLVHKRVYSPTFRNSRHFESRTCPGSKKEVRKVVSLLKMAEKKHEGVCPYMLKRKAHTLSTVYSYTICIRIRPLTFFSFHWF